MSDIVERTFKCTGCGEARPCTLTTTQSKAEIAFFDPAEYLECVLDKTNKTAHNWKEVQANEANKDHDQRINYEPLLGDEAQRSEQLFCCVKGGFCPYEYDNRECKCPYTCTNQKAK